MLSLWPRWLYVAVDIPLAVVFSALALLAHRRDIAGSWVAGVFGVASCVVTPGRYRFPVATLWMSGIASVLTTAAPDDGVGVLPFAVVAGTVIASGMRRTGIVGAVAALAALAALEVSLLARGGDNSFEYAATPLVLALGVAVGLAVDYRRRGLDAVEERIRKAEGARDGPTAPPADMEGALLPAGRSTELEVLDAIAAT